MKSKFSFDGGNAQNGTAALTDVAGSAGAHLGATGHAQRGVHRPPGHRLHQLGRGVGVDQGGLPGTVDVEVVVGVVAQALRLGHLGTRKAAR